MRETETYVSHFGSFAYCNRVKTKLYYFHLKIIQGNYTWIFTTLNENYFYFGMEMSNELLHYPLILQVFPLCSR